MKKNIKIILIIFVFIVVGIVINLYNTKTKNINKENPIVKEEIIVECYKVVLEKDVYTLTILSQEGETFTGTLSFNNFEIDSSSGTYNGTYKDGILLGDYSFHSEGMFSVMQVIFKKTENGFVRGFGETNKEGTHFVDIDNIDFDSIYVFEKQTECKVLS
jgi:uncharacterized protein YxeA